MPLLKYFGFAGGALLSLLLALNWLLPDVKTELVNAAERPVIRISSIEKLPEKVDFDTNSPTIASPTMIVINTPAPQSAFVFVQITPGSLPSFSSLTRVVRTAEAAVTPHVTKQIGRGAAKLHRNVAIKRTANAASMVRLSLIDDMRSRFGQSSFKLN